MKPSVTVPLSKADLADLALETFASRAARSGLRSFFGPGWDGWATAAQIQWRLSGDEAELPVRGSGLTAYDALPRMLDALASTGRLERRVQCLPDPALDGEPAPVTFYRLPGDDGVAEVYKPVRREAQMALAV